MILLLAALTIQNEGCKEGERAFVHLQLETAAARLEVGLAEYGASVHSLIDFTPFAECMIQLGAVRFFQQRQAQAQEIFRHALALRTKAVPDPDIMNPAVLSAFARARNDLARLPNGGLSVAGEPVGADVVIDGVSAGRLPISVGQLIAGPHWVVVKKQGYQSYSTQAVVAPSSTQRVDVFLKPLTEAITEAITEAPPPVIAKELVASRPVEVKQTPPPPEMLHPLVRVLPFGIAQFAERRPVAGSLFLTAEVLALAANIVTAVLFYRDRGADGAFDHPQQSSDLQIGNLVAIGALAATIVGGAVDGAMH